MSVPSADLGRDDFRGGQIDVGDDGHSSMSGDLRTEAPSQQAGTARDHDYLPF
jgi:hypothetical protein